MPNDITSQKIKYELVNLLYQQMKFGLWAEFVATLSYAVAMWGVISTKFLLAWTVANILIGVTRKVLIHVYNNRANKFSIELSDTHFWLNLFAIGTFISGVSWGLTGSLLMPNHELLTQMFAIVLLIGITCAANPFYSPDIRIYGLFLIPAFLPLVIWMMMQGDVLIILGILSFIYILLMLATSMYSNNLIYNSLHLRFKNIDLMDKISVAKINLEKRTKELEKSVSLTRATLESTTDGILVVNAQGLIDDSNQKFSEMWNLKDRDFIGHSLTSLANFFSQKMKNPEKFITKFHTILDDEKKSTFDEIYFNDGRVIECYSNPQLIGEQCVGRVWSFRDVTRRKYLEDKLYHQANYDLLTNLPNRSLSLSEINKAIEQAEAKHSLLAIFFLDIDRFKLVNDTLGHSIGDKLLTEVAIRLLNVKFEGDIVSREGGDEFLMMLANFSSIDEVNQYARKLLRVIKNPFIIDGNKFSITISIGISCYPENGKEADMLIRNADIAMYRAKQLGRNNFQFYNGEINDRILSHLVLENQLWDAFRKKQFSVVYQPIVSFENKNITGVEALLRWDHPELGEIPPTDFVPIAEQSGAIVEIGAWVLRTACKQMKKWHDAGFQALPISVNLSSRQFRQPQFYESILKILAETQLNPQYLALELTETIIMDDAKKNVQILADLRDRGVCIVIDDFGTGYSSLNYLKRLPVDKLKIDRSFIADLPLDADDVMIVSSILELARGLALKVVAEGVETKEQFDFLAQHNCDEIQGFYFSRGLSASEFTKLLEQNKPLG